jgi:hypothetical protein
LSAVSGETKVVETWRFEIPSSLSWRFFESQPKALLPSSRLGKWDRPVPNDAKSVPEFFGSFKPADFGNFTPPFTSASGLK